MPINLPGDLATVWPTWSDAALINSWTNVGGAFVPARYRKSGDGKLLALTGTVAGGATGTVAFILPAGWRPPYRKDIGVIDAATGGNVAVQITNDGHVTIVGSALTQVDLDFTIGLD